MVERLTDKKEADSQRREYENRLRSGYPRNIPEERFLRLAAYEDTGLMPDEVEQLASLGSNTPLTLEELRGMDGEPVWVILEREDAVPTKGWALVETELDCVVGVSFCLDFEDCGAWLAYRRKPEEGSQVVPSDQAVPSWAEHLQTRFLRTE